MRTSENTMRTTRLRLLLLPTVALVLAGLLSPAAATAAPYCGITWGSLPKASSAGDREFVHGVRAGRHPCYDRLVIDLNGQDAEYGSYDVRYVPQVVADGSGAPVPVRGGAVLQVTLAAAVYDEYGNVIYLPRDRREVVDVSGFRTFRQVAWAGSFEGYTTLALGVRARLPFQVFVLPGTANTEHGPRLVVDVAHRWQQ